jgi:L-amino acid N-acyltransferase YncA
VTSTLTFRRARDEDWSVIWPIWHEVVAAGDTYTYDPATSSDEAKRGWLAPAPDETWLAFDADTLVGFYHLAPNQAGPGAHVANASYMVDRTIRGRGVGRALVEHSLERARTAGYRGIQFNAVAATNVWAVKLYLDLGFETIGTVPGGFRHPEQGYVDLLIMYRPV